MHTQVTARHFEASPKLRTYAQTRLAKLERFYDGITDAQVTLTDAQNAGDLKSAEIVLHVYRRNLKAQHTGATHEEAIDHCVNRLRRQILKYKDKLRSKDKDFHH